MTSSPGCRHGEVERSSRSSTGDAGKKLSGVSENMPSVEVCETCLAPQILASAGQKERLLTLKMNGQPQPSEKTSPTGKMVGSDSDHQVATAKTPSPLSSQQQCVVGKSSRGSSNTSLASAKDHVTQILANGKSPSSNSLSDQRVTERKSSRSSEHERKSSRSSDQNRIIISSNNNEPMSDSNEIQNHQQQQQRVSVGDVKVTIQEHSSESTNQTTEGLSPATTPNSACFKKEENTAASNDINTQDNVHKQPCDTSLQRTMGTERTGEQNGEQSGDTNKVTSSEIINSNSATTTTTPKSGVSKDQTNVSTQQTIVISCASPEHGEKKVKSKQQAELPAVTTTVPPLSPSKVKALTGVVASKDALTSSGPSFSQRLLQRKSSQGKKGAGNNSGTSSSGRRLCDEEDELSEVEPDAVPSEVRDWLALTFTRSMSNIKRRGDDKPKFRSVAHAIRAGIMVDR